MIDTLYDAISRRHAGAVALGVAAAMGLWLWQPEAPSWFHLGGAFVVATLCTGGIAEVYVQFIQSVEEATD